MLDIDTLDANILKRQLQPKGTAWGQCKSSGTWNKYHILFLFVKYRY